LGAVLYVLLVGEPPFPGKDDYKVMESISSGDPLRFRSNLWKKVSSKAKNLITKMLERDVKKRYTAAQVMEDVWF
jgi:calcium-dependent protein kinase